MTWRHIVLVLLAIVASHCTDQFEDGAEDTLIYILPTSRPNSIEMEFSVCQINTCYTLANFSSSCNIETNTKIILLPGTHSINGDDSTLQLYNVQNISIIGQHPSLQKSATNPKIECMHHNSSLINVHNVTELFLGHFEITGCKEDYSNAFTSDGDMDQMSASIKITSSSNVRIQNVYVHHGNMIGLMILQPHVYIGIWNSRFSNNRINCFILKHEGDRTELNDTKQTDSKEFQLMVNNSVFQFGRQNEYINKLSSGLYIEISATAFTFRIDLTDLSVDGNQNGDLQINLSSLIRLPSHLNILSLDSTNGIHNCMGRRQQCYGLSITTNGSVYVFVADAQFNGTCVGVFTQNADISTLRMTGVTFQGSRCKGTALSLGNVKNGALDDLLMVNCHEQLLGMLDSSVSLQGTFKNNTGSVLVYDSMLHIAANGETRFENNDCTRTEITQCSIMEVDGSIINMQQNSTVIFKNNTGSSSGAMSLNRGTIHLFGNVRILFEGNSGKNGGAFSMYAGSKVVMCEIALISLGQGDLQCKGNETTITMIGNYASEKGGATYVDDSGFIDNLSGLTELFLKTRLGIAANEQLQFYFSDNRAKVAGNAFYGGWVIYYNPAIFHFNETRENDLSLISSDPVRVCMCLSLQPRCEVTVHNVEVYPGQSFNVSVVTVGQRLGTVPAVVEAVFNNTQNKSNASSLAAEQNIQNTGVNCTSLRYTVFSVNSSKVLSLTLATKEHNVPNLKRLQNRISYYESMKSQYDELGVLLEELTVEVTLKPCPVGFALNVGKSYCHCDEILLKHGIDNCNIETLKIFNTSKKWINATFIHNTESNNRVIVHDYCPFNYCETNISYVSLDRPDDQCAFNRSGILCGACGANLSAVLGSSKCRKCSNFWILLVIPVFIVSGILLVVLLICLNLIVSSGYLNGLIFYANIIRANELNMGFFQTNTFFRIFIAWLNLDFGIETCFYDGLDAYAKTWFQLLFPVYLWAITLIIIVSSRHYTFVARLCGSKVVQVLATLFLLSYAKLIRTIITIFQTTTLVYPDGYKRRVWLYDGNVDYLRGKHIPLFITGLLVLLFLSIPYTVSLLFIQWLRKYNHLKLLRWVGKLKPLFDAYTGPFKEKHCYWFGVLLLLRVALYTVFSLNTSGNSSVNLMAIGITSICMLTYLIQIGGTYTSWVANLLEALFLMNLGILSLGHHLNANQRVMSTVSLVFAFFIFVLIVLHQVYIGIIKARRAKKLKESKEKFKEKLKTKLEESLVIERGQQLKTFLTPPVQAKPRGITHTSLILREPLLIEN